MSSAVSRLWYQMEKIYYERNLKLQERAILFHLLMSDSPPFGENEWPSFEALAEGMGVTPKTVERWMDSLYRKGVFTSERWLHSPK